MKVIKFKQAESYEPEKDWKRISLCSEKEVSVEHFVKPALHSSPMHQHTNAQVLIVLKGTMAAVTEQEEIILEEGDCAYFPPDEIHAVKNLLKTPSVGIDIFGPGRSFDFWKNRKKP